MVYWILAKQLSFEEDKKKICEKISHYVKSGRYKLVSEYYPGSTIPAATTEELINQFVKWGKFLLDLEPQSVLERNLEDEWIICCRCKTLYPSGFYFRVKEKDGFLNILQIKTLSDTFRINYSYVNLPDILKDQKNILWNAEAMDWLNTYHSYYNRTSSSARAPLVRREIELDSKNPLSCTFKFFFSKKFSPEEYAFFINSVPKSLRMTSLEKKHLNLPSKQKFALEDTVIVTKVFPARNVLRLP